MTFSASVRRRSLFVIFECGVLGPHVGGRSMNSFRAGKSCSIAVAILIAMVLVAAPGALARPSRWASSPPLKCGEQPSRYRLILEQITLKIGDDITEQASERDLRQARQDGLVHGAQRQCVRTSTATSSSSSGVPGAEGREAGRQPTGAHGELLAVMETKAGAAERATLRSDLEKLSKLYATRATGSALGSATMPSFR